MVNKFKHLTSKIDNHFPGRVAILRYRSWDRRVYPSDCEFNRTFGTGILPYPPIPANKLAGYCQTSLRDWFCRPTILESLRGSSYSLTVLHSYSPTVLLLLRLLHRFDQLRKHLVDIAHDTVFGRFEDRRVLVGIDGNDML